MEPIKNSNEQFVANATAELSNNAQNLTTIPLPITPKSVWESTKHAIGMGFSTQKRAQEESLADGKNRITQLTGELCTVKISDLAEVKKTDACAITTQDASVVNKGPTEVANHIQAIGQRAKTLLAGYVGMLREAKIALWVAFGLIVISALGVVHPLMIEAMGANTAASELGAMVWAVIISTAIALTVGVANVTFFRASAVRISPLGALVVGVAFFFLLARYVAAAIGADFMLMDALPAEASMTIRILKAVGVGVALICVEMGAGRALAFAWRRYQQSGDRPRLQQILLEIEEWVQLRSKCDAQSRAVKETLDIVDLYKLAVLNIVKTINTGLAVHHEVLRQHDMHVTQPWTGSTLENLDIAWLKGQVELCEQARNALLNLAGLDPQSPVSPVNPSSPLPSNTPTAAII